MVGEKKKRDRKQMGGGGKGTTDTAVVVLRIHHINGGCLKGCLCIVIVATGPFRVTITRGSFPLRRRDRTQNAIGEGGGAAERDSASGRPCAGESKRQPAPQNQIGLAKQAEK